MHGVGHFNVLDFLFIFQPSIRVQDLFYFTITYSWEVKLNGQAGDPSGFSVSINDN